jgi:4-amino-4-deoxychorismate lyase
VKVIVTRGTSERGYRPGNETATTRIVGCYPWPDFPADNPVVGVRVRWCRLRQSRQPLLAGLKHLNRLEQVLARAEWQDEYVEGLMCDDQGQVIEGTMSNLFLVNDGTLITPDLSESGVAGVMRAEVLAQAEKLGMTTKVLPVTPSMVETAEELFLTNSLIGIWPITRLETKAHVVGKITKTLQSALQDANITA